MLLSRKDSTATDTTPVTDAPPSSTSGLFRPSVAPAIARPATTASPAVEGGSSHGQKLIVGQGISLAGEITAC